MIFLIFLPNKHMCYNMMQEKEQRMARANSENQDQTASKEWELIRVYIICHPSFTLYTLNPLYTGNF